MFIDLGDNVSSEESALQIFNPIARKGGWKEGEGQGGNTPSRGENSLYWSEERNQQRQTGESMKERTGGTKELCWISVSAESCTGATRAEKEKLGEKSVDQLLACLTYLSTRL